MSTAKKCKKLGNRATKAQRAEAHRAELEMREVRRAHDTQFVGARKEHVFANISTKHEHWGETPAEHERRKNNS